MKWTTEQNDAIYLEGNNIIVSAGAGSGKTAVLTERVLRKIKEGSHIDQLLIMTFTNAAAKEMKDRIRKKLKEENQKEELNLIDAAYISTFDSFSLSIVKKYHYLLNLEKNITITDDAILNIEKQKLMDQIFDEYYLTKKDSFKKLIKDFCYKDDDELKKILIKLNDKLEMKIDKTNYLETYISNFYNQEKIKEDIKLYYKIIKEKINTMEEKIKELSFFVDSEYLTKLIEVSTNLFNSKNYNEIVTSINFRFPNLPKNSNEESKNIKETISKIQSEIKKLCIYENEKQIEEEILSTKSNLEVIIEIISTFSERFNKFKKANNMASFQDISKLAIKIVEENKEVRDELRNKFTEIMVDEYQDTNDIQEYFISLISKNNVYMVGDIKQSIYRFRNANPTIFKNKYDLYSKKNQGIKIDLVKNFRSREEVLKNINEIFNYLMNNSLGGANYQESHQMIFGNKIYQEDGKTNQNNNLEILCYNNEKNKFSNSEKEIFAIGNDILQKIKNNYQVLDKDKQVMRNAMYQDFVILLDRSTDFDLYKKIFEYLNIPLTLYKDEEIRSDNDILIIRNILKIEKAIDQEDFGNEFKYAYLSVGRSFLFELDDSELFNIFNKNKFKETIIYKKCEELYNYYYEMTPKIFFLKLLEIFNYEENILKLHDIKTLRIRLEYFYQLLEKFEEDGKTIEEFIEYLDLIFESSDKATFSLNTLNTNSVKIMTIHKSKGLEYPICYFAGFTKEFSFKELNETILYSNKYGIITPYFNTYQKDTIYKTLFKLDTKKEELSEKIRLLYVALTRAKEKMIMIIPNIEENKIINHPTNYEKEKITSFLDMIYYIYPYIKKYIKQIEVIPTKDYLINNNKINNNLSSNINNIQIDEINFEYEELTEQHFSKNEIKQITKEEKEKMRVGTRIHEILEYIDFRNPDYSTLTDIEKEKISKFIKTPLITNNLDANFYKEFEFIYQEEDKIKHGIIDLMIECDDKIIIIDYKLKNIEDLAYQKQLLGYKDIIAKRSNKKIELYLYSILEEKYEMIS